MSGQDNSSDFDATTYQPASDPNATEYHSSSSFGNRNAAESGFTPGSRLNDNFRLEGQLGRGGMGEAWKALDETANRFVVLKFIPKEIQHVKEAVDSVRDSFAKVHELQHQHICPVYGLFTDPHHGLYLVMKFIDGRPLDEYKRKFVEKHGKMSFSDIIQILWGVAKGLDYAHEKRVIHRDIKPQNIMISKKDGVQIIDFGLAEEIRTSMVRFSEVTMDIAGTRPYMAPEQWQGKYQDAATDQYALAVTAYELFSGKVPFQGSDVGILRECVLHDAPDPIPNLPDYINAALLKALSKQREDRFENCKTFVKTMATKPKEAPVIGDVSENATPSQGNEISLPSDRVTGVTPPPVWQPQTMMSSEPIAVLPERKPISKWVFPVAGFGLLLPVCMIVLTSLKTSENGKSEHEIPVALVVEQQENEILPSEATISPEITPPQQDQIVTETTVEPAFARPEPLFPKEFHEIKSLDELRLKISRYLVDDLKNEFSVVSENRWFTMGPYHPNNRPERIDAFECLTLSPPDLVPIVPERFSGYPCRSPGYCHLYNSCRCSLLAEDCRLLNRLKEPIGLLILNGLFLQPENLEILFRNGPKIRDMQIQFASALPDLKPLLHLEGLQSLHLTYTDLNPSQLETIALLPNLRMLNLSGARLAPETLAPLNKSPKLENLHVTWGVHPLGERELHLITELPHLTELEVRGSLLRDSGLEILAKCPKLKKIYLDATCRFTDKGLESFRKKRPKIEIVLPKNLKLPIRFEEIADSENEVFLGDILFDQATVEVSSPGSETMETDTGKREKSIWAAAPSRIVFRPKKRWKTFESGVALVKQHRVLHSGHARPHYYLHMPGDSPGTVYFVVKGDGKELYRSKLITDTKVQEISVDISDVDMLELIVEDGDDGSRFDAAAWFSPKLSR